MSKIDGKYKENGCNVYVCQQASRRSLMTSHNTSYIYVASGQSFVRQKRSLYTSRDVIPYVSRRFWRLDRQNTETKCLAHVCLWVSLNRSVNPKIVVVISWVWGFYVMSKPFFQKLCRLFCFQVLPKWLYCYFLVCLSVWRCPLASV